ncbi:hypothetical protein [Nostoc phage N1]|nr:hypothetical protein [Nostoc phage N1]
MDQNRTILQKLEELEERLINAEKPSDNRFDFRDAIPLASLIVTLVTGFTTTLYISVSKITTLEIKNQHLTEYVSELKKDVSDIKNKLDDIKRSTNNKAL